MDGVPARVRYDEHGNLFLHFDQPVIEFQEQDAQARALNPQSSSDLIFGEELIHAAHLTALRRKWDAEGRKGTFGEFVKESNAVVLRDIQATLEDPALSSEERLALHTAISDAYRTYFADFAHETNITPGRIFERIAADGMGVKFVGELLRMAAQMRKQGEISESVLARLKRKIADWVRDTIPNVKAALPGMHEGKFGKEAQTALAEIEAELDSLDRKTSEPSLQPVGKIGGDFSSRAIDPETRKAMMEDALKALETNQNKHLSMAK